MPKSVDDIVYMTCPEVLSLNLIKEGHLKKNISIHHPSFVTIKDPSDRRRVLIRYESLPDKYKAAIREQLGDPAALLATERLEAERQMLTTARSRLSGCWAPEAEEHGQIAASEAFDKTDPHYTRLVIELATASAVCRFYNELKPSQTHKYGYKDKKALLAAIHEDEAVKGLLADTALPFHTDNIRRFRDRFKWHKERGWQGLVSRRYGNQNSLKIRDEAHKAFIRQVYGRPNNFDYVQTADYVNRARHLYGWPELSPGAVREYLESEPGAMMAAMAGRNEYQQWRSMFDPSISRNRPSKPGYMWVLDATDIELFYQAPGKKWGRWSCCMVIDAYNDTVLGLSVNQRENVAMITRAIRMAMEITGMMPWEIKSDRFSLKQLEPLYYAIARHVSPSEAGNARDKVIESFFNRFKEHYLKPFNNWSGSNITARLSKSQANREYLNKIKKDFPDAEGCALQIIEAVERSNGRIFEKEGKSRLEQWQQACIEHKEKIRPLTPQARLDIFGRDSKYEYTYTAAKGIEMTLEGEKRQYKIWDKGRVEEYMALVGRGDLKVRYLPEDLSMIRVFGPNGLVSYIEQDEKMPMCRMDRKAGDQEKLNRRLEFKRLLREIPRRRNAEDMALLERECPDAAKMYLIPNMGGQLKYTRQDAEALLKIPVEARPDDLYDGEAQRPPPQQGDEPDVYDY